MLNVGDTTVTAAGAAEVTKALPACRISR
jgi:hypothetical protein